MMGLLRRRTPGERIAYRQGYTAALRRVIHLDDVPADVKNRLGAEFDIELRMLAAETEAQP